MFRGPHDPAFGIRYNKITETVKVSKELYTIDIARTPMVIKTFTERADVMGLADAANRMAHRLYKKNQHLEKGHL